MVLKVDSLPSRPRPPVGVPAPPGAAPYLCRMGTLSTSAIACQVGACLRCAHLRSSRGAETFGNTGRVLSTGGEVAIHPADPRSGGARRAGRRVVRATPADRGRVQEGAGRADQRRQGAYRVHRREVGCRAQDGVPASRPVDELTRDPYTNWRRSDALSATTEGASKR